jgi:hypothetical protein
VAEHITGNNEQSNGKTILGIENMTSNDINYELQRGGRFVIFPYCVSLLIVTLRRSSDIYFIKFKQRTINKSIGYIAISLFFGWWGIPWGPVYTIISLVDNLRGGKDVTKEVIQAVTHAS